MSIFSSEEQDISPLQIILKVLAGAVLLVGLNKSMYWIVETAGLGEIFAETCAYEGYRDALSEGETVVVGASDALSVDPNLIGIPTGIISIGSAGFTSLYEIAGYVLENEPGVNRILLIINPISLSSDYQGQLDTVARTLGQDFNFWLLQRDPVNYFKPAISSLLGIEVWSLTVRTTDQIGDKLARCDKKRSMHGISLLRSPPADLYASAKRSARIHAERTYRTEQEMYRQLESNLEKLIFMIDSASATGREVTVILPPLHHHYRSLLGADPIVARVRERLGNRVFDLTRSFDDKEHYFHDSHHLRWPEGSKLGAAMFFEAE